MKFLDLRRKSVANLHESIAGSSLFDPAIEQAAADIIRAVRARGDDAVIDYTERFDGARLTPDQLVVSQAELFNASLQIPPHLRHALGAAARNVGRFARRSLRKPWRMTNAQGARVGEKFDAFERVGIYVPGGTAPLVSTVIMTVMLARAAGCEQIVVCSPCDRQGHWNAALTYAARTAGATELYRIGGVQAIAAMALGTRTVRRVQKIYGPGNAYVVAAKRLLFGFVGIDLLPGPSELLVIADDSASPRWIAADLMAQTEHGSGHERVWLVSPSRKLLRAVEGEMKLQLKELSRAGAIRQALANHGCLIHVASLEQAVAAANALAPEHCQVMTRGGRRLAAQIKTAGAIFIGEYSPTVAGDYIAGPSHVLPTGGAGRSFAGLTVDQFQRRTSVVEYTAGALKRSLPAIQSLASVEGLEAHARSAAKRFE